MTEKAVQIAKNLKPKNIIFISINDLEKGLPILTEKKKSRSKIEYYFTCTPVLIEHILKKYNCPYVEYIDADMFFFFNSNRIFHKVKKRSVAITAHRFLKTKNIHEKYGKYNVGWLYFRNNKNGRRCLRWWKEKCLQWCFDRFENNKYADQKYLESFPKICNDIKILKTPGFNEAPWNISPKTIHKSKNGILIGKHPLILYHFSGLRKVWWRIFDPTWSDYHLVPNMEIINIIYLPYLKVIYFWGKKLKRILKSETFVRKESPLISLKKSRGWLSVFNEIRKKVSRGVYIVLLPKVIYSGLVLLFSSVFAMAANSKRRIPSLP